ncbi:hypothetical protein JB92DRAFT_2901558 [Gautieria morchelliformis]|nr:hypothetical protein JB92DRAFT_2901558 [Gautieria morchelliformis]
MALKRKLEVEVDAEEASYRPMKQLRVTSVQSTAMHQADVAMGDASYEPPSASTSEFDSDASTSIPAFDMYPFPSYEPSGVQMDGVTESFVHSPSESRTSSNASEGSKPCLGLMQPKPSFVHNVSNCYQIPRLRVSCESGIGGQRTLWTQCDQCGAIDMIDRY